MQVLSQQGVVMEETLPSIEVDAQTGMALEFAARMARVSPGELVARLVAQSALPVRPGVTAEQRAGAGSRVAVHVDYAGCRTKAWFTAPGWIDIEEGPLAGQSFKSPSGAARAVVARSKPGVDPARNGWIFWTVSETGQLLETLR